MPELIESKRSAFGFLSPVNALYALFPLCYAVVYLLPVVSDLDATFTMTDAFPAWLFILFMLPASMMMLVGSPKRWYRTALIAGLLAAPAMIFADLFFGFNVIDHAGQDFVRHLEYLERHSSHSYFKKSKGFMVFLGWGSLLAIPALLLNILALVGYKYRVRTEALPTLNEIKEASSRVDIQQAMGAVNTDKVRSLGEKAASHLDREKVQALGQKVKSQIEDVDVDKLTEQVGEQANALKTKSPMKVKLVLTLSVALVLVLIMASSEGPSESDVIDAASVEFIEMGFAVDVDDYDISDCEASKSGEIYRCIVSARVTLTEKDQFNIKIESVIKDEVRTFVYEDGFLRPDANHLLSNKAQSQLSDAVASAMLGELFGGLESVFR